MLLLGALLPDIIDKPLGSILFLNVFQNGRIFGHTLIFNLCFVALGVYLTLKWNKNWMAALAFGSIMHLILDETWLSTGTLLWPAYGWHFPVTDITNFILWLPGIYASIMTHASLFISETIGIIVLLWFTIRLILKRRLKSFLAREHF